MAVDIGELRGIISLQDNFSGPANDVAKGVGLMSESFGAVTGFAGLVAGAVTGAAGAILAMGSAGAGIADVRGAFSDLAAAAGSSADVMLGELTKGTLGTISNFELMQKANSVLGSGMIKSASDMGTLAAGAKRLADRTGKDTAQALDILTSSIEKGRTAGLKQLGVFVDNAVAVDQYAQKIGKSVGDLNDQEKAQALSAATLAALRGELQKAGPATADFGDMIDRGKVAIQNFTDDLSLAISASPVLGAGLQAVGQAIQVAFGGNQSDLIKTIMGYVESFAIGLTHVADVAVTGASIITAAYNGLKITFDFFMTGFFVLLAGAADGIATLAEKATSLPGVGGAFKEIAAGVRGAADQITAMRDSFVEQTQEAIDHAVEQEAGFNRMHQAIGTVREAMEKARTATVDLGMAGETAAAGVKTLGDTGELTGKQLEQMRKEQQLVLDESAGLNQLAADKYAELQERLVASTKTGLDRQLEEIAIKQQKEIEGLEALALVYPEKYAPIEELVKRVYANMSSAAVTSFAEQSSAAAAHCQTAVQKAQEFYDKAANNYFTLANTAEATDAQILKSFRAMNDAKKSLDDTRHKAQIDQLTELAGFASSILRSIFGKNKAAAIAAAIIDTAAAVAKALSAYPWPFSLAPAAAAAAAGYAQVNAIRSQNPDGFSEGTPGTAFEDFGRGSLAVLHGSEAVVTRSQGESVAGMVEEALANGQGGSNAMLKELKGLRQDFEGLPWVLRNALRDPVVMATRG